jgi:hypothetical protein
MFEYKYEFSLATWTTYKNYREQLAQNDNVQLEKKNVDHFQYSSIVEFDYLG